METERADLTDSIADTFTAWGASIGVVSEEDRGDVIIQRALSNTGSLTYDSNSAEGHNSVTKFKDLVDWVVGTFSAVTGNGIMSLLNGIIVDSLPLLQGYLVLITAALLPLVMLVTLYSPKTVISLAFFLMAILLWPGMWAIARWIDNVLLESIFDGYSILGMQLNAPAAILSIIAMLGYIGIPVVFSKMLIVAGSQAGSYAQEAVGNIQQSTQGSINQGANAAGRAGRKAVRKIAK
jgi:small-conductance mechanosensitive channel